MLYGTVKSVGSHWQHRSDANANGEGRNFVFATGSEALGDACDLNCACPDAHLRVRTVPANICENECIWLISPVFFTQNTIFLGFFMENP
jgi:hypothetical protein